MTADKEIQLDDVGCFSESIDTTKKKVYPIDMASKNQLPIQMALGGVNGTTGWFSVGVGIRTRDTTEFVDGNSSIKATNDTGVTRHINLFVQPSINSYKPFTKYTFTIRCKTENPQTILRLAVERRWYMDTIVSENFYANGWTTFSFTFETQANQYSFLTFMLSAPSLPAGDSIWWDAAQVEEGETFTGWEFSIADEEIVRDKKFEIRERRNINQFADLNRTSMESELSLFAGQATPPTVSRTTEQVYEGTYAGKIQWNHTGGWFAQGMCNVNTHVFRIPMGEERIFKIWTYAPIPFTCTMYITGSHGITGKTINMNPVWEEQSIIIKNPQPVPIDVSIYFWNPSAANVMYVDKAECFDYDAKVIESVSQSNKTTVRGRPYKNIAHPNIALGTSYLRTTNGFGRHSSATIEVSIEESLVGGTSLKVFSPQGINEGCNYIVQNVEPNLPYSSSLWVKGTGRVRLEITERREHDNTIISNAISSYLTLTNEWQELSVSKQFGPEGTRFTVKLLVDSSIVGGNLHYVDKVQVEQNSVSTEWEYPGGSDTISSSALIPVEEKQGNLVPPNVATCGDVLGTNNGLFGTHNVIPMVTEEWSSQGTKSIKLNIVGNGFQEGVNFVKGVMPGQQYTFSAVVNAPDGVNLELTPRINPGWGGIGGGLNFVGTGQPQRISTTFTVPQNATYSSMYFAIIKRSPLNVPCVVYVDEIQLERGALSDWKYPGVGEVLEPLNLKVAPTVREYPGGMDSISALQNWVSLVENGVPLETIFAANTLLPLPDSISSSEAVHQKGAVSLPEPGVGVEAIQPISNKFILPDTGEGQDTPYIVTLFELLDIKEAWGESLSISTIVHSPDAAEAVLEEFLIKAYATVNDEGIGEEEIIKIFLCKHYLFQVELEKRYEAIVEMRKEFQLTIDGGYFDEGDGLRDETDIQDTEPKW